MIEIIGVRFKNGGKVYYFSPGSWKVKSGDLVITETARGTECGEVAIANKQIPKEQVTAPLNQILRVATREDQYSRGTGVTAACNGRAVRCGSFAAPLYGENAADASIFTLNLAAGRDALLHCFCAVPEAWQTLALTWHPDFAAGRSASFTVRRAAAEAVLGSVPTTPAEVGSVVDL